MQMASSQEELERIKDLFLKRRESKKLINKHDSEFLFMNHLSPALPYISSGFPHKYFDRFIILLDGFLDSIIHKIILGVELIS